MWLEVNASKVFVGTGGRSFDPKLPTTMFVHGACFDRTVWKLQSRYFAWHGGSVLALDLPGHGRSEGPPLTSISAMADWIVSVMDVAGVPHVALVGHSMGALACLETAARYRDRVGKLALLGAAEAISVNDILLQRSAANDRLAIELLTAWGYGRLARYGGHRMPGMWLMGGGLRLLQRAAPDVLHTDLVATNNYSSGEAAAAAVTCATLLIIGERDVMTPASSGLALADQIRGAKATVISKAGHIMLEETPDETLSALKEFLIEKA